MARTKSVAGNRRTKRAGNILSDTSVSEIKQNLGGFNYRNLSRKLRGSPILLNAGIGVGAYFLVKYAIRFYKAHPEIADFVRENLDTVEDKVRSFRGTSDESTLADARH